MLHDESDAASPHPSSDHAAAPIDWEEHHAAPIVRFALPAFKLFDRSSRDAASLSRQRRRYGARPSTTKIWNFAYLLPISRALRYSGESYHMRTCSMLSH